MNIPMITLIPLKYISWGIYKISNGSQNFHWQHMKFSPYGNLYNEYVRFQTETQAWATRTFGALDPEKNFNNIHFHFLPLILRIIAYFIFVTNYGFSYIFYYYMKNLSAGQSKNIDVLVINNERGILFDIFFIFNLFIKLERRATNHVNAAFVVNRFQSKAKARLFYYLQTILFLPLISLYVIISIIPILFFWYFTNFSWHKCIFGPYLLNVFIWISEILTIFTIWDIRTAFPYFDPLKGNMKI